MLDRTAAVGQHHGIAVALQQTAQIFLHATLAEINLGLVFKQKIVHSRYTPLYKTGKSDVFAHLVGFLHGRGGHHLAGPIYAGAVDDPLFLGTIQAGGKAPETLQGAGHGSTVIVRAGHDEIELLVRNFLRLLQEQGYEVKRGKYVSFRAPGQGRFIRCKTLGEAYTEEAITERIKGRFVERKPKENRKISLRIDLENSIKAQQSAGYEKWAKLHNLKQAARTLNFLTEHEIESYPDLESRVAEITAASTEAAAALKAAERRLAEMAVLIKDVTTCKELRPLVQEYQRAADKKQFWRKHEGTLILYEAAAKALKEQGFQKLPDLYALKAEYKQLAEQKDQLQRQYAEAKRQMQEYGIIKQNVDGVLCLLSVFGQRKSRRLFVKVCGYADC